MITNTEWWKKNPKLDDFSLYDLKEEQWDYYLGNHFKSSNGGKLYWTGAFPIGSSETDSILAEQIEKLFTSYNIIKECIDRHVSVMVGARPTFEAKQKAQTEVINDWLEDIYNNSMTMQTDSKIDPITQAVTTMFVTGQGYIRIFQRDEYDDPLKKLAIHSPDPDKVVLKYTKNGLLEAIIYQLGDNSFERQELDYKTGITNYYLYNSEEAFNRNKKEFFKEALDLNWGWSILGMSYESLITESVMSLQNTINLSLTMMQNNQMSAGFMERIITNATPPGKFVPDGLGGYDFEADPNGYVTGAGASPIIPGIPIGDPANPTGYTNPSVIYREPVDPESFIKTVDHATKLVYYSFNQAHLLNSGDGGISGTSRITQKEDYKDMVHKHRTIIESVLTQLGTSVMLIMAKLKGESTAALRKPKALKAVLNLTNDTLLPEEHREIREDFIQSVISHYTTLERLGFKDPQEELDKIAEEKKAEIQMMSEAGLEVDTVQDGVPVGVNRAAQEAAKDKDAQRAVETAKELKKLEPKDKK